MSLEMTALRLQVIAALNSHPAIVAVCGGRIYDSRISDFDYREPVPVIVVTTESLTGESWSANNGGAPFDDRCNLVLEIAVRQRDDIEIEAGAGPEPVIMTPATDRETEALLNLIAFSAEQILTTGQVHPLAPPMTPEGRLLLDAVTRRVSRRSIERFSSDETAERLAIHLLTLEVELKSEEFDAANPPAGEFAALPGPLRRVCEAAPDGSSASATCRLIAAQLVLPELRQAAGVSIRRDPPVDGFDPSRTEFAMPTTP